MILSFWSGSHFQLDNAELTSPGQKRSQFSCQRPMTTACHWMEALVTPRTSSPLLLSGLLSDEAMSATKWFASMSRFAGACLYVMHAICSDPWNDVTHECSVDPVCYVIIHICNLEKLRNFRVFGAANDVNHVSHSPGPVCVLDDHCHTCLDVEKDRICFLERWDAICLISWHTPLYVSPYCFL